MKLLVITDTLWRNDNNVGNSYSNIFNGIENLKIANICCQQGKSSNNIVEYCFQISEKSQLLAIFQKKKSGYLEKNILIDSQSPNNNSSIPRLQIFFIIRELIWKIGKWKSKEIKDFICNFQPDLIFVQMPDKLYIYNIALYVQQIAKCPMVGYAWDDIYTLKQFSLSVLFWIDKFFKRKSIRNFVKHCKQIYVISEMQKEQYSKMLHINCKILHKGYDCAVKPSINLSNHNSVYQLLYTGNIGDDRWKSLFLLGKAIEQFNGKDKKFILSIYTATPINMRMRKSFESLSSVFIKGKVNQITVNELQKKADILVHVEPFTMRGKLKSRLSFSTKLVDYFYQKKCILCIGSTESASIEYLAKNNAAIVAESKDMIIEKLKLIYDNYNLINIYAKNAYNLGIKNHNIKNIQTHLINDFKEITLGGNS